MLYRMRSLIALSVLCLAIAGCAKKEPEASASPDNSTASTAPPGGSGGNVTPLGPNVGSVTPVTGDLEGAGGGGGSVRNVAKGMAKEAAGKAGTPAGMGGGEDDGG